MKAASIDGFATKNNCILFGKVFVSFGKGKVELIPKRSNITSVVFGFRAGTDAIWVLGERVDR